MRLKSQVGILKNKSLERLNKEIALRKKDSSAFSKYQGTVHACIGDPYGNLGRMENRPAGQISADLSVKLIRIERSFWGGSVKINKKIVFLLPTINEL